jgi:hypothetical protein
MLVLQIAVAVPKLIENLIPTTISKYVSFILHFSQKDEQKNKCLFICYPFKRSSTQEQLPEFIKLITVGCFAMFS